MSLQSQKIAWIGVLCSLCLFLGMGFAQAASDPQIDITVTPTRQVHLEVNQMARITTSMPIESMAVVNDKVADLVSVLQMSHEAYVRGLSVGTTQVLLWDKNDRLIGTYDIVVRPNLTGLKKNLYDMFPGENILVSDSGEFITLSGTVSSASKLDGVLRIAEAYTSGRDGKGGKDKIVNLLQVGGVQQVMLEVRVAEISKKIGHRLGINFSVAARDGDAGLSLLDGLTVLPEDGWPGNPLTVSSAVNAAFSFLDGNEAFTVAIDALQDEGLLKILAKPTLIAQCGQTASFLAGGEFPFPLSSDDDVTITWKPFGVALNFTPTVLGDGRISLTVSPEVSELDFTKTIVYAGFVVPSLDTRRASTVVELNDNQSFAIAGLMKNNVRESVAKFPLLGDIPILGALFRSTKFQNDETELVIVVTPRLVKPTDGDQVALPTDAFVPPNPFELLMFGRLEGYQPPPNRRQAARSPGKQGAQVPITRPDAIPAASQPGMQGDFGHIIPD